MMKTTIFKLGTLLSLLLLTACGSSENGPRFQGRIVSHVDSYASGTGNQSSLLRKGTITSGFHYGDPSKPDWASDISWSFLRQNGGNDLYQVKWTFSPGGGTKVKEVDFNGTKSVIVFSNQWEVISIEPGKATSSSPSS